MVGRAGRLEQAVADRRVGGWLSDEDVAAAAVEDASRFDELYHRFADRVYRYALARTGSDETASDITGDVMVAAMESIHRFDQHRAPFSAWLFTIAHRKVVDHHRSQRRWRNWISRQPAPPPEDDNALGGTLAGERRREVQAALATLPANQRDAVILRYIADLPIRDVGSVLGISEGAVKMRLNRAMQHLATELKETSDER